MKKITFLFIMLFSFFFTEIGLAQSVATQDFEATGTDDDNFQLSIVPEDITVNNGQTIQSVTISNYEAHYEDEEGVQPCLEEYEWFYFDLSVTGGAQDGLAVLDGCESDYIGLDVSGFSNLTFTSVDADDWGDLVYLLVTLEVTYESPDCTPAVSDSETVVPDCDNSEFSIDVDLTTVGDATEITDGTDTWSISGGPGVVTVGPFSSGANVSLELIHSNPACNYTLPDVSYTCPAQNDDCTNVIALSVNEDYECGTVTNGTVIGATDSGADDATCYGSPDDDVWYSFVATSEVHRVSLINITGSATDMYMTFYDASNGCGDLGDSIYCSDSETANLTGLTIGTEYFVQVYTYTATSGQTTVFDICVGTPPPPPVNDDFADAIAVACDGNYTGSTEVATLDEDDAPDNSAADLDAPNVWYSYTGSGTAEDITLDLCPSDYDSSVLVYTGTSGDLTLVAANDDGGEGTCGEDNGSRSYLTFQSDGTSTYYITIEGWNFGSVGNYDMTVSCAEQVPAPDNDLCDDAEVLVVAVPSSGTTIGATAEVADDNPSCESTFATIVDVWYSFVATEENMTITTTVGSADEANVAVYEDCTLANQIGCSDANGGETLDLTGLTVGTSYTVRVWNDGVAPVPPSGDDLERVEGDFTIVVNATLSDNDFENEAAFTYYPNPVKNTLKLNAQNNIENVVMYNMLGQEVLRATPNAVDSELNMSQLQDGTYFVKVTIANVSKTIRVIKQ